MSDFIQVMQEYFRGEKLAGFAFIGVGLGLLGFAIYIWRTHEGAFVWGLALPLAIVGVMAVTVGPFFALQQDRLASDIAARYADDPAELARTEGERMTRVNANWPRLKLAWAVIGVIAMALILLVKQDWSSGLGVALMLLVAILFTVDVLGERRAIPYAEALTAISPPSDE
ncbi:MAG: hypothetical protein H6719_13720 [Sandaracinaceae bacterium]|nr:hypothetical protein [Sandaracinaceae bacterium]